MSILNRNGTIFNIVFEENQSKIISEVIATYKMTKIHRITHKIKEGKITGKKGEKDGESNPEYE